MYYIFILVTPVALLLLPRWSWWFALPIIIWLYLEDLSVSVRRMKANVLWKGKRDPVLGTPYETERRDLIIELGGVLLVIVAISVRLVLGY